MKGAQRADTAPAVAPPLGWRRATVTNLEGFGHGPLSNTGPTAQLGGVLELVTPAVVHTTIPGLNTFEGYAVLHVEFIPEPASAALAGLGLALLGVGGWRRRARGER